MQVPGRPRVEVVINGNQQATNGSVARLRPLSVDEALQYSPLTTSVTAGYERIPIPDLGQSNTSLRLVNENERASREKLFDSYKDIPVNGVAANKPFEALRADLNGFLNPDELSEFNFKGVSCHFLSSEPRSRPKSSLYKSHLSPLAKMILESSEIAYRYPTPTSPSPKTSANSQLPPTPASSKPPNQANASHNSQAFEQNSWRPSKQQISIKIPPRPPYEYGVPVHSPKRRKLNGEERLPEVVMHYQAQKDEAERALSKFQDLLLDLFEAYDCLQPDTSHFDTPQTSSYFEEWDASVESTPILTTKTHSKLQNAIKKLRNANNFEEVAVDDVKRLQKICEGPLLVAQTINLIATEDASEDDVGNWRVNISRAENGLTSACTLGWTILGSLDNKELCPEDVVQALPILLTNVFENCLVPVVESRSGGRTSDLFNLASGSKELLARLLHQGRKLLSLMAELCLNMESAETAITRIEYLATHLIFVESSFTEKDSVLGVQVFETVRKTAMEALAKIFSRFPDQRQPILDEILSSLQKLSTTKQGARQFKLVDGKNIQLVSALVMQLVQTVANEVSEPHRLSKTSGLNQEHNVKAAVDSDGDESVSETSAVNGEDMLSATQRLSQKAGSLYQKAVESANYIINYFVQRAKVSTKTGDQPHRNLLDLFTEDLINVLGSPDWPAAELLLWILARHMLSILSDDKSAATAKNMALELLGWMGSAISNLLVSVQNLSSALGQQDTSVGQYLTELVEDQMRGSLRIEDVLTKTGPFRITIEYLAHRDPNNWQLTIARGYYLTVWAKQLSGNLEGDRDQTSEEAERLSQVLLKMFTDVSWSERNQAFEDISPHEGRLAYLLTVLHMGFCKAFDVIVKVLLQSLTSDQAKMRSRSLKSVVAMLEADPKLLDRDEGVMHVIFRCASDSSPMVRDNALSLIAKCMSLRPGLEEEATRVILERGQSDVATGVRKRCIAILKDIYLRNSRPMARANIARSFLCRLDDPEETVAGLAHLTLADVWITPFLTLSKDDLNTAKAHVALMEQVNLMVKTVIFTESANGVDLLSRLEQFYRTALNDATKTKTVSVSMICSTIVDILFELILHGPDRTSKQDQRALLSTLQALAKADSKLIKPEQLQALEPYIQNLSTDDDLFFFRSVVVIYRCVLPRSSDKILLKAIQNDLMRAVSKLGRAELNEAVACLWTIDGVLKNTERLVKLTMSLLKNIKGTKLPASSDTGGADSFSADGSRRLRSYLRIAGCVGKHCDLESFAHFFREIFPSWEGTSVAGLMVDLIYPWTIAERPPLIRSEALHSLASICESWPGQFSKEPVRKSFSNVLEHGGSDLQHIVLSSFLDFFKARELATETLTAAKTDVAGEGKGRLDSSLKASDYDGAAALIAQHFLWFVLRISISGNEQIDYTALEVVASINRQGLVHPKECAGALVALETSPRALLAQVACDSHRLLHQQHETMFEREYPRAVREAFEYQRDILKDSTGAKARPFVAKLSSLYEIVKTSNIRYVRKFLKNLIQKVSTSLTDLAGMSDAADQLLYSRFLVQNLAYLEYGKLDELIHAISFMESHVGKAGAEVAQAIELQVVSSHQMHLGGAPETAETAKNDEPARARVAEPAAFRLLTTASMMLTMLWELRTHLRRQYGITGAVREMDGKGKDSKELAKIPAKVHGITGERFSEKTAEIMTSLDSEERMLRRCHAFVQLMTVDDEVKVAAEVDEMRESASVDREASLQPLANGSKGSRGKRKSSASVAGTPKKKRGRPSLPGWRSSSGKLGSDEDWD